MSGTNYLNKKRDEKKQIRRMINSEKYYNRNFFLFEMGFIFFVLPLLIISLVSAPFLYYYIITKEFQLWPFIVVITMISFIQILALQYFFKRFYLEPHEMTFGEYMRYRFDKKKKERKEKSDKDFTREATWYDNLDEFIENIKTDMREQSNQIYSRVYHHYNLPKENN